MSNERIHYLNGLRGILAVIVFIHHFLYAFYPDLLFGGNSNEFVSGKWTMSRIFAYSPFNMLANPGMAINFFFLLSGYVQSHHYLKTQDDVFLKKSFIKRYFRLAIPVVSVLMLVYLFHRLHLIQKNGMPYNTLSEGWIKSMLPDNMNILQVIKHGLADCFTAKPTYYQVLWTMAVELYNSWMVIILLLVTHQVRNKIPLLVVWLVFQCVLLQSFYAVMFTLGLLICQLHLNSLKFSAVFSRPFVRLLCLLAGLYFASYPFTGYETATEKTMYKLISFFDVVPHVISYAIGDTLLFLFLLFSPGMKNALSKRVFQFFGEISFMFYLVHFLLLFSFSAWLYKTLLPNLVSTANLWLTGLASFFVITLASYLLTKWIDKPALRFCNTSIKRIFDL